MKKRWPLVSVGIPTYNRPEGLRRTLKCITGQTYRNLEIIVSDNCSPGPETEAIVREFMDRDSRIQYFCQEKNRGPEFNFKFVLEKATGEYFMWAADDDYFEHNTLISKLVSKVKEGNYILAFPNINLILITHNQIKKNEMTEVFKDCKTDYEYLIAWCGYGGGYPVYGLYNLEQMSLSGLTFSFDGDLRCFGEGTFLHRVFLRGGARFVEDVSMNYVRSGDNASSRVIPPILLVDFLRYTKRVLLLYVSSQLSLTDKIKIITIILKNHIRYIARLLRSTRRYLINRTRKILKRVVFIRTIHRWFLK